MKISIIIPVYNEVNTILTVLKKVNYFDEFEKEIIIVDDYSSDGTLELIEKYQLTNQNIKLIRHSKNLGKGAGLRSGIKAAENDILIIQDADLEYDPKDYSKLIKPIIESNADVVFGSRFLGGQSVRVHFFWHYLANKLLTLLTNILMNMNFTDMETGYKVFKKDIIKKINLKEDGFGIEPEITIKLCKEKAIFYEVPISYYGRSYKEGKKIKFSDAIKALICILKYTFQKN